MNVSRILSLNFNQFRTNKTNSSNAAPIFGIKMSKSIDVDTVSFSGKLGRKTLQSAKDAARDAELLKKARENILVNEAPGTKKTLKKDEDLTEGLTYRDAKTVHKMISEPQKIIKKFMHDVFDNIVATTKEPKHPIAEIKDRAKKEHSIWEKSATRGWKTIDEVLEKMTDLNGVKIMLRRKAGRDDMDFVLNWLIPHIKTGQLEVKEIEIKRPIAIKGLIKKEQEKYDYASLDVLKQLVDVQESVWNTENTAAENIRKVNFDSKKPEYTKGNYSAIHFLFDLPNKDAKQFECQFMGYRMGMGKDLDDILFKFFDGKTVDKKYNRIVNILESLMTKENAAAKERFMQYRKDALLNLRQKELAEAELIKKNVGKNSKLFIDVKNYGLPPEYDLNYLMEIKNDCDKKAAISIKNLEEAKKAKKIEEGTKPHYVEPQALRVSDADLDYIKNKYTIRKKKSKQKIRR